jgi:hypothetical protein
LGWEGAFAFIHGVYIWSWEMSLYQKRRSQTAEIPKSRSQRVCTNHITFIKTSSHLKQEDLRKVALFLDIYIALYWHQPTQYVGGDAYCA